MKGVLEAAHVVGLIDTFHSRTIHLSGGPPSHELPGEYHLVTALSNICILTESLRAKMLPPASSCMLRCRLPSLPEQLRRRLRSVPSDGPLIPSDGRRRIKISLERYGNLEDILGDLIALGGMEANVPQQKDTYAEGNVPGSLPEGMQILRCS